MRHPPLLLVLILGLGLVLAACAAPSESNGPDESNGGGPGASEPAASEPAASEPAGGGGGGGGLGTGSGSVQFEITGAFSDSGELPFAGDFAYFQQAGVTFLVFTDDTAATEANGVILTLSNEGNVFQYVTEDVVVPAADCEWNIDHNDATGAAGSFNCADQAGYSTDGQFYTDLDINGTFDVGL